MRALLLADFQNLFYGSRAFCEDHAIDASTLGGIVASSIAEATGDQDVVLTKRAYLIKTPKYNGLGYFTKLRNFGYDLHFRKCASDEGSGSVTADIQLDMLVEVGRYDCIVGASGHGALIRSYTGAKANNPNILCFACGYPNTIHKSFYNNDVVDGIIELGTASLRLFKRRG